MSGAGENNRWPRSRQTNRQNSQNERTSGANTPTRDGGRQQAAAALSGNAWTQPKGKATGGGGAPQSPVQAADSHVPVQDFNAAEVKNFLKKRYLESIGGVAPSDTSVVNNASNPTSPKDQSSIFHKVQGDSVKRSSGAWGSRGNMPHLMPSGQDFFTHLKKQLGSLEQGKTS